MQTRSLSVSLRRLRGRVVARGERFVLNSGITLLAMAADWGLNRAMAQLPEAGKPAAKAHHRPLGFSIGLKRH